MSKKTSNTSTAQDPVQAKLAAAPILAARGVVKTYRTGTQEVPALRGVDLDVWPGELVMVMGPSGNGKTTLLNCLSGLDDIDAGTVTVDGTDLFAMSDADRTRHRAERMGFVSTEQGPPLGFVCLDDRLLDAAEREGLRPVR